MEDPDMKRIWETYMDLQEHLNQYNMGLDNKPDTLTMGAPIHLSEGPFIKTLWGSGMLHYVLDNHEKTPGVLSYLNNILLPSREVNIQKMEPTISHKKFIISANEIQSQHINTHEKIITIPIKAFEGKSLLTIDGPPDMVNPTRYYFILLQSAKDPNIVKPIRVWIGERTREVKSLLVSNELVLQGWEVQIEQGAALVTYIKHNHTEGKDVSISIPKSLYNAATGMTISQRGSGTINSTTHDPTKPDVPSELEKLLIGWGTLTDTVVPTDFAGKPIDTGSMQSHIGSIC